MDVRKKNHDKKKRFRDMQVFIMSKMTFAALEVIIEFFY